jgi:hypothetical protein
VPVSDWSDEKTRDPLYADDRNFYKVEQWTRDGMAVEQLLYAGNSLAKAEDIFARAIKHRPRIRLTIRRARACCNSLRIVAQGVPQSIAAVSLTKLAALLV